MSSGVRRPAHPLATVVAVFLGQSIRLNGRAGHRDRHQQWTPPRVRCCALSCSPPPNFLSGCPWRRAVGRKERSLAGSRFSVGNGSTLPVRGCVTIRPLQASAVYITIANPCHRASGEYLISNIEVPEIL